MKTKEYIKKYKLDKSDKFNHSEFISDLTLDFMALLQVGKAEENIKGFDNAVRAIRMKYDAINKKTVGCISEKLWGYFWATVVVKFKERLYPEIVQREQYERAEKKKVYEERKKREQRYDSYWDDIFFHSLLSEMFKQHKPIESFEILGLNIESTIEDVKKAYRNLCIQHHPDKGGKPEKFIEITNAKDKCLAYFV